MRKRAVNHLPEPMRERLAEEWAALLADTPGPISKLWCALGFLIAAPSLRMEVDKEEAKTAEPKVDAPVTTRATGTIPPPDVVIHTQFEDWWVAVKDYRSNSDKTARLFRLYRNSMTHGTLAKRSDEPEMGD
jgi:hypothetical protein